MHGKILALNLLQMHACQPARLPNLLALGQHPYFDLLWKFRNTLEILVPAETLAERAE